MKILRMNSQVINSTRDFSSFFSPYDLLFYRNEAAVFILNKFRFFTPCTRFFSVLFFLLVRNPSNAGRVTPETLADIDCMKYQLRPDEKKFIREHFCEEEFLRDAKLLFDITRKADLPEDDRNSAFCMLLAGYRLALRHPDEEGITITPEKVADAYRSIRKTPALPVIEITDSFDISVSPSVVPYEIQLDPKAGALLLNAEESNRISVKRITLGSCSDKKVPTKAVLRIKDGENQSEDIILTSEDSIFINFVKDIPVFVHPTVSIGDCSSAIRKGSRISYYDGSSAADTFNVPDIVCALPEPSGCGFMMLRSTGLDSGHYSKKDNFIFDGETAAEIHLCTEGTVWLSENGVIFSDFKTFANNKKYVVIRDFLNDLEKEKQNGNSN